MQGRFSQTNSHLKIFDIPSASLLCSILFPTGLTHAVADLCERNLYLGGVNGNIFKVDLTQRSIDSNDNLKQVFEGHR